MGKIYGGQKVNFRRPRAYGRSGGLAASKSTTAKDVQQDRKLARISRIVKQLKPEVQYRLNNFGTPGTGASLVQATPQLIFMNNIAQGVAETQVTGNKYNICFLEMKAVVMNIAATRGEESVRCVIFVDKNPMGLARYPFAGGATPTPYTTANYDRDDQFIGKNFKILYDKTVDLTGTSRHTHVFQFKKYFNKNPIKVAAEFGAGTSVAHISNGAVHCMIFTNQVTANNITTWGNWTVGFVDQ